jgi:hypothetical protein
MMILLKGKISCRNSIEKLIYGYLNEIDRDIAEASERRIGDF